MIREAESNLPIQEPKMRKKRRESEDPMDRKGCTFVNAATLIMALVPSVLIFSWFTWGLGDASGFAMAWGDDKWRTFNWHGLCMTFGFATLTTTAVVVYKIVPARFVVMRALHGGLQFTAIVFGSIGLFVVFQFKAHNNYTHLYTAHSWLGIIVFGLVCLQFVSSLLFALKPKWFYGCLPENETYIRPVLPFHIIFGFLIYILLIMTLLTGILQRQWIYISMDNPGESSPFEGNFFLSNMAAMSVIVLFLFVAFQHRPRKASEDPTGFSEENDVDYQVMPG